MYPTRLETANILRSILTVDVILLLNSKHFQCLTQLTNNDTENDWSSFVPRIDSHVWFKFISAICRP